MNKETIEKGAMNVQSSFGLLNSASYHYLYYIVIIVTKAYVQF